MSFRHYRNFSSSVQRRALPHGVDSIFGWTIFIFLLIGFTLFCWMGSFYIFGHPEKAGNYHLLKRLHKLEEPQRFQITAAPRGEFLKPSQLLERYGVLSPTDVKRLNETLFRNFLRNYHQTKELVPYVTGTYKVLMVLPLTKKNIFFPGVVTLLQSMEEPEVFLEQVFTSNLNNLPALEASLSQGQEIKLEKPLDLSAMIFLDQLPEGRLKFTTMPLLYGTYGTRENSKITFSLEPPENLNIEGGLPILTRKQLEPLNHALDVEAQKFNFLDSDKPSTADTNSTQSANTALIRITEEQSTPITAKVPQVIPGQPQPSSTIVKKPSQAISIPKAIPVNAPPTLPAIALSSNTPSKVSSETPPVAISLGIPEKQTVTPIATMASPTPAIASTPTPTALSTLITAPDTTLSSESISSPVTPLTTPVPMNATNSMWPLYEAGKMPRGRLLSPTEFSTLAEQGFTGERLYLIGDFTVTASGEHRAVLRYRLPSSDLPIGRIGKIRIIVEYPPETRPPETGTSLSQDRLHPLMVTDVKKEKEGTMNIYLRSITK
jgi:hypothetical protein